METHPTTKALAESPDQTPVESQQLKELIEKLQQQVNGLLTTQKHHETKFQMQDNRIEQTGLHMGHYNDWLKHYEGRLDAIVSHYEANQQEPAPLQQSQPQQVQGPSQLSRGQFSQGYRLPQPPPQNVAPNFSQWSNSGY